MKKLSKFLVSIVLLSVVSIFSYGQGCSDAGFCTINTFKPNSGESLKITNNQFNIGMFIGKADLSIAAYGTYLEYNRNLNKQFGIGAKLTTLAQSGNGIATFGLSDIFLNANYKPSEKLTFTFGAKLPLSNASKTRDLLPLPMDYQASLGTLDLILGIGYEFKKIQFVAALQQPLTQNKNQFLASKYPANTELRKFQSTNSFERSGDVLLRISYPITLHSKLRLTPSLLPIYHLKEDNYTDEQNSKRVINGSEGLTLNGNAYLDYQLNPKNSIQLSVGMPFTVREVRPDGLTRSIIANIEYRIRF